MRMPRNKVASIVSFPRLPGSRLLGPRKGDGKRGWNCVTFVNWPWTLHHSVVARSLRVPSSALASDNGDVSAICSAAVLEGERGAAAVWTAAVEATRADGKRTTKARCRDAPFRMAERTWLMIELWGRVC